MFKKFNIHKFIQLAFFLQKTANCTNYMKLIKLMYLADRYHIRHYGITMTFDDYYALERGPVGSQTKDILVKDSFYYENIQNEFKNYLDGIIDKKGYDVEINIELSENKLSESQKEAIIFVIEHFNKFDQYELSSITHDYPEWKKYKSMFENKETSQEIIHINDLFDNPDLDNSPYIKRYLGTDPFDDDLEFLQALKEDIISTCQC